MANTETTWQEITVNALLGTLRRPFSPPQPGSPASGMLESALREAALPLLPGAAGCEGERALLRASAVAALHYQAGRLPARAGAPPTDPCPPDIWPACSPQAGSRLLAILSGGFIDLLPEWLETAARLKQRVREEHLPDLLHQRSALEGMRPVLLEVLGERGRWLARQNPDWQKFETSTDESVWHEGKRHERLLYLSDLRRQDPERACDLLASTWGQEAPAEKSALLEVLEEGLSMADEPFLEQALDDRRKEVRRAAARLLARLPGSRLAQRAEARARRMLLWKSGLLRSGLEVRLPDACDDGMQRDGIEPRPPAGAGLGEKVWWLVECLSLAPPDAWCSLSGRRPRQLLESIRKHEWEEAIYLGWRAAAMAQQHPGWLEALLEYELRNKVKNNPAETFARLPAQAKEAVMISLAGEYPVLSYETLPSMFLSACRHPWSPDLSHAVIRLVCHHVRKGELQPWRWDRLLAGIAPYIHPSTLPDAVRLVSAELNKKKEQDNAVEKMLAILQFRKEMLETFNPHS